MWLNNFKHGFGRSIQANGEYYVGMFKDGKKHGQGKLVYQSGKVEEGNWRMGTFIVGKK